MSTLQVRFAASSEDALDRLAADPIAEAAEPAPLETRFFRDLVLDTPEGDLEGRGAWVRVRVEENGEAYLAVELDPVTRPAAAEPLRRPIETTGVDLAALLAASSMEAARVRAMADPARLAVWLEVQTRRRTRTLEVRGGRMEICCDTLLVRDAELSAPLHEVEIRLTDAIKGRRKLLRGIEARYGLVPVVDPLPVRARRGLAEESLDWLEEAVRASRRVAVVGYAHGNLALRRDGRGLRIPSGEGSGEDAARRVLRESWEQAGARLRLLGTGPGSARRPAIEVWLAEGSTGPLAPRGDAGLVGIPLAEALAAVGAPGLRDETTLAALHVLARSDLPTEGAHGTLPEPPEPRSPAMAEAASLEPGSLLNMELSTLAFNRRVLALAADRRAPLMERVRFLSIVSANLDEFFRVRVAGFKRQVSEGSGKRTLDDATAQAQLDAIGVRARRLTASVYRLLVNELLPSLEAHGVMVVRASSLTAEEARWLDDYYELSVHSVLTPLAAGPGHPFPHIRNLRPAIAAMLREPATGTLRLGVIELPDGLPRFVPLPTEGRFVPLEDVIIGRLGQLYRGTQVEGSGVFRVTRSAELHLHGRADEDLLQAVQEEVAQRRFRPVVRVEVEQGMPDRLREALLRELRYEAADRAATLGDQDLYPVPFPIDLRSLRELAVREGTGLTFPPLEPVSPLPADRPVMESLREREWLVRFPQDSFQDTVERFVLEAADDPDVLAIKLALYRTNRRSRIVEALRRASAAGKQVVALVELTARFDEQSNIEWARYLRRHGIHVIYGVPGIKVHAKIALVVRREGEGTRRYAYVGTGNLNAQTSAAYTDLGLFTADPALSAEVAEVFNLLTASGSALRTGMLLVAPFDMREGFLQRIRREAEHARAGHGGHIRAKFNGLADREVVAALYEASSAGVRVDLIVRSLCVLRPGVRRLSENIRVISIVGRFLEHARIFHFANAGEPEYFIGSADWRTRNLSRRVEVAAPVRDPAHRALLDQLLDEQWNAPDAWELGSDGTYYQRPQQPPRDEETA
jgi:polyphosphate kinase